MALYADKNALIDRFGETEVSRLTDRANLSTVDENVLTQALTDASHEIDGHLVGRYQLPLSVVPTVLIRVCCDLARYHLHVDGAPEHVMERYKAGIRYLENVASGKVTLGLDANSNKPSHGNSVEIQSGGRVFDRENGGIV